MRLSTSVLAAALAVSAILNVALLTRGRSEPAAPAPKSSGKSEGTSTSPALAAELERERASNRELRETVQRLEGEKAVLAQAATTPNAPAAAVAAPAKPSLREKLRKLKKVFKTAEDGLQPDQEAVLEMSGDLMEIMKLGLARSKDPEAYADFLRACAEITLEDEAALTPDQQAQLGAILKDMSSELGRISADTGVERLIRELEIESAAVERMKGLLTPAQKAVSDKAQLDDFATMSSAMGTSYLQKGNAEDTVVKAWTQSYQLQEAQLPAARAAAQTFVRELTALGVKAFQPGANYDARLASLRAQLGAIRAFEGALSPAQRDRLRQQPPREFHLIDFTLPAQEGEK